MSRDVLNDGKAWRVSSNGDAAILLIGLLALYVPTAIELAKHVWIAEDQSHGPIIFFTSLWLIVRGFKKKVEIIESALWIKTGILYGSLFFYILGRSQSIVQFEVGSFIGVIIALMLHLGGTAVLRNAWFGIFFLIFMVPLPGIFVQTITIPLKFAVSYAAEHILHYVGLPVARVGVTIAIGQYQLLVADACAGLNSMFTLEALGLLYLNLSSHLNARRSALLGVLIIPISFCSNVVRVLILVLLTYYGSDDLAQGFAHGFAGMVLFATALSLIFLADKGIGRVLFKTE
jgi:exosortase B